MSMSARTIAAIAPEFNSDPQGMKRTRPEDDGSDDDISIVSRSPSPDSDRMDVDTRSYNVYRPAPEAITVETRIRPENKGFALLAKMGWTEGQPLGLSEDGRVDPIPFQLKNDSTGIGKTTQDVRMIETTVSQRRGLDSERQRKETEDQRRAREDLASRKAALENEISATLRPFYCEICDKQFKNVAQYDEHTNSYAHHHKARLRDMHVNARPTPKDELDKRKEKERRREEKELRKIAAANGIKMPKPLVPSVQASTSIMPPAISVPVPYADTNMDTQIALSEPKKSGWATVSSGFNKSNWSATPSHSHPELTEWASLSMGAQPSLPSLPQSHTSLAPTFRNAGWTSLDTSASEQMLTSSVLSSLPPVPTLPVQVPQTTPQAASVRGGWKQFQSAMRGKSRR